MGCVPEVTLEEILGEPITVLLMDRDGVSAQDVRALSEEVRIGRIEVEHMIMPPAHPVATADRCCA